MGDSEFLIFFLVQDVKGPQTVAFNLPNDERIVKDRGTSMVMLKNVSEAKYDFSVKNENFGGLIIKYMCIFYCIKVNIFFNSFCTIENLQIFLMAFFIRFKLILQPIADACISKEQQQLVDFDSFFTHTICHECCHGIGPHAITLPNGKKSTVRLVSVSFFGWISLVT